MYELYLKFNQKRGFTLIEMLIVVTIVGILAAIILPRVAHSGSQSKHATHLTQRKQIIGQIELFHFQTGIYPADMEESTWSQGGKNYHDFWPEVLPKTCNYQEAWVIDPSTHWPVPHPGHE